MKKFKIIWISSLIASLSLALIVGSLITFFKNPILIYHNPEIDIESKIKESIRQRQILIRSTRQSTNEIKYCNAFVLNKEKVMMPLSAIGNFWLNKKNVIEINDKVNIEFVTIDQSINKNINNLVWQKITEINDSMQITNSNIIGQYLILETKNELNNINTLQIKYNHFLREETLKYKYYYSSIYIENFTVKYVYADSFINKFNLEPINSVYKIFNQKIEITVNNVFTINSTTGLRNIGSIGSLIIDPIGFITGIQLEQNKINEAVFYGINYEI